MTHTNISINRKAQMSKDTNKQVKILGYQPKIKDIHNEACYMESYITSIIVGLTRIKQSNNKFSVQCQFGYLEEKITKLNKSFELIKKMNNALNNK